MNIAVCGIDLAKNSFQIHGVDEEGQVSCRKKLKRSQLLKFFTNCPVCLIGMEACGGAHYWARELSKLGHTVRLMSPQHVKPYITGNKNDANDAEGICEAVTRPKMTFVGVKTRQQQDILLLHRVREQKVKNRTALANQIRGLLAEYGYILPKSISTLRSQLLGLISEADDDKLSYLACRQFYQLYEHLLQLDDQIKALERELQSIAQENEDCRRLASLPGVGLITATALVASIGDITQFKSCRALAAYLGIVPRQHSTGGKAVLLGISKRGDSYLRGLLVHGARSVLLHAKDKEDGSSLWLKQLAERRGYNKAIVAQANKTARRVWALLTNQTYYQVVEQA